MTVLKKDYAEVIEYGVYMADSTFCIADGGSLIVSKKSIGCLEYDGERVFITIHSAYKEPVRVYLDAIKNVRYNLDGNTIWITI